jgi:RNA polymerase sigma-70 factor (ECF subfamily)
MPDTLAVAIVPDLPVDVASTLDRHVARGEFREALSLSARAYGNAIGRLCMAFVGVQSEAEELTQETLLCAYDAFPSYRGDGSLKAFLFGIARRVCARAVEKRVRREGLLSAVGNDDEEPVQDAQELVLARERAQRMRQTLTKLRPTEREALLLRYESELSFREIASACGCDEAAARKRVSRGLATLRGLLEGDVNENL